MAAGADPVDLLRVPLRLRADGDEAAARDQAGPGPGVQHMLAAAAVAGLAADADLDEVALLKQAPRAAYRPLQHGAERLLFQLGGGVLLQEGELLHHRAAQPGLVGHGEAEPALCGQQGIDHLALIGRRPGPGQRPEDGRQIGDGVVAEDAGPVPHRARP